MQHKWHKEIKAWADGAEIESSDIHIDRQIWKEVSIPCWDNNRYLFRIKPRYEEEPYWLCCGCKDPRHNKSCSEAKMGHPERCKFGTASEHFKAQPKEPQYLYVIRHPQNGSLMLGEYPDNGKFYVGKIKLENDDVPSNV